MSAAVESCSVLSNGEKSKQEDSHEKLTEERDARFMEIPLSTARGAPKRIVHFCDGVLEEYSTEEEGEEEPDSRMCKSALVDVKTLSWLPYMLYLGYWLGAKTLSMCDYLGENLAHFFGITTPKYQYEIEEYQRILQEEDEAQRRDEEEKASGWVASGCGSTTASTEQLTNVEVEPSPFRITLKKIPTGTAGCGASSPDDNGQRLSTSSIHWERF